MRLERVGTASTESMQEARCLIRKNSLLTN